MQERNVPAGVTPPGRVMPPLTARSVLASALLGEDPPELPVAHLVHLAGLFGINENRARVALSRMVAAGEVDHRRGRPLPAGRPPARPPGPPGPAAGGARPGPGTGGGAWWWSPRPGRSAEAALGPPAPPGPGPAGRAARGGVAAAGQHRPAARPGRRPRRRRLLGGARRGPGGRWPPPCGTSTGGPAGPGALDAGSEARPTDRPGRPGPRVRAVGRRAPPPAGRPAAARRAAACRLAGAGAARHLRPVGPPVPPGAARPGVAPTERRSGLPSPGPVDPAADARRIGRRPGPRTRTRGGTDDRSTGRSRTGSRRTPFAGRVAVITGGGPRPGPEPRGRIRPARCRHRRVRPLSRPRQRAATRWPPTTTWPRRCGWSRRRDGAACRRWPTCGTSTP